MKIRTLEAFQDGLDKSSAWRVKEIADLSMAVKQSAGSLSQKTLIRAGVPLLYAHWEGFIKEASQLYLEYVASRKLKYVELSSCFVALGARKILSSITESNRLKGATAAVDFFRNDFEGRSDSFPSNSINTRSNLKSEVFLEISTSIGVNPAPYEAYFNLIDESLLARRNSIAHGEYLPLDARNFEDLVDNVLILLRMYKNDLENQAS